MCSLPYWLSTSLSTMITFSLVRARLVCQCCALIGAIFAHITLVFLQGSVVTCFGRNEIANKSLKKKIFRELASKSILKIR